MEILVSHPRFYWGETGSVLTKPLFAIPIPSSRDTVPTGYGYVLPDQNGWSRYLHFQTAWPLVFTGVFYVVNGLLTGNFKSWGEPQAESYNALQRLTYLLVVFVLFPLSIWSGLAMSPAVASAVPLAVEVFGGQQSARTLHFLLTVLLVAFLLVHVTRVWFAGFRTRMRGMITGR